MAFFRNLFRREPDKPASNLAIRSDDPMAFYLDGNGRMSAVKSDGIIHRNYYSRVGLGYLIQHAEQYARAAIASVWAANCINLRSDTMARLDWHVRDKKNKEIIEGHPFTEALENSRQNVIRLMEKRLLTFGEFFLKPLHNDYGLPAEFLVLNNLDVDVDTASGTIDGFSYNPQGGGQMYYFFPADKAPDPRRRLIYIYTDNDFDDYRGLSRLEHVLLEINIDRDISRTTAAFYRNDARPGLLLIPETDLTDRQADEFIDQWNARLKGPDKSNRPIIVPKVIKEVKDFQRAPALDDVELRESTRREICAAFKVPLSMAGAWDDATYQSLPEQRRAFYEETIIPAAESHARDLSKHALPYFDESTQLEVYFDAEKILSLVEDTAQKVELATRKLNSGAYTINEIRADLGDEKIPGGNIHLMQSGWIPVPADQLANYEAPNTEVVPGAPQLPAPADEAEVEAIEIEPTRHDHRPVKRLMPDGYASISFADNRQLINIQRLLKDTLPDGIEVEWQIPSTFHITLVYAPQIDGDELFNAANGLTFNEFMIGSHQFGIFENGNERALHLVIDPDLFLSDLQREVYERFNAQHIELSEYSNPEQWQPHITLAYLPQGIDIPEMASADFNDMVTNVTFTRDNYETFAVIQGTSFKAETIHDEALAELRAWQKFYYNGNAAKRDFETYMIREDIAFAIRASIANDKPEAIKAVFKEAEKLIAIKAVNAVRSNFELEMKSLIDGGRTGNLRRAVFTNRLKRSLRQFSADAYLAGLTDGGVITNDFNELDAEDAAIYQGMLAQQLRYAKDLAEQVYKAGLSDAQARLKPRQWWGKSMLPFYDAGLLSANRNGMIEIIGPIDENSCDTCKALVGQRHRRRTLHVAGLIPPYGSAIICSDGGLCKHRAISVNSRSRGNLSRVPKR